MSSTAQPDLPAALPVGTWTVDPAQSRLQFTARGMFGLAKAVGRFERFTGELTVGAAGAHGELRIEAASLTTENARRDTHLRSADFFDAERHPVLTFRLLEIRPGDDAPELSGELAIRESRLRVDAPLELEERSPEELRLRTAFPVDRAQAGVGWSKLGMIRGDAALEGEVVLRLASGS